MPVTSSYLYGKETLPFTKDAEFIDQTKTINSEEKLYSIYLIKCSHGQLIIFTVTFSLTPASLFV
jgi:hypothetical protein